MQTFKNKHVLITGGNSGIGYATAREFIDLGARVMITGRRKAALQDAASALGAIPVLADQSRLEDIERLARTVSETFGQLDLLFINAGIIGSMGPIAEASVENFNQVMDVNFRGAYFTLSCCIPLLREGASVVILSSNTSIMHRPGSSIYQASKAALSSMAKTAAAELAPRQIRVNIISPGPIKTPIMSKAGLSSETLESINDKLLDTIPLKTMGEPEDVARMVRFIGGDQAGFTTGAEIIMDGGMSL